MIRRPPRSTRTDTLFPYTTLFRSLAISIRTWPRLRMQRSPKSKKSYLPASLTPITSIHPAFLSTGSYDRSEEHTSELQSLMRISYAVFCLKKKKQQQKALKYHHLLIEDTDKKPYI